MEKFYKVAAIVPALNEGANVGGVLKVLLSSKILDEVILVDDGSTDKTAEIGKRLGAEVVKLSKNTGKGNAMRQGLTATDAEIIVFFDADLIGLTDEHIFSLVNPVIQGRADMCIGVRGRLGGLPRIITKIDPLMAIGGERAIKRHIIEDIPEKFTQGFAIEIAMDYFCKKNDLKVVYADLPGLSIIIKEKKWGFIKGFVNRIKMTLQIIKIRLTIKNAI